MVKRRQQSSENNLFSEVDDFLPSLDEQFRVADHLVPVQPVHAVAGPDPGLHHPVIYCRVLLGRGHALPRRAIALLYFLSLLHDFPCHGVDGGEILELLRLHAGPVSPGGRQRCRRRHFVTSWKGKTNTQTQETPAQAQSD